MRAIAEKALAYNRTIVGGDAISLCIAATEALNALPARKV